MAIETKLIFQLLGSRCAPREVTYDIGLWGCAYKGSNPDPKIWVHQNYISEFSA